MIEPDINERMARFAPSQNPNDPAQLTPAQVEFAQSIRASADTELKSNMLAARTVNPDQAARAAALGNQIGVGADLAVRNLDEVERRAYMQRLAQLNLSESDPTLARFLANRNNAMIAHDDVEALHQTQGLFGDVATSAITFGSEVYQAVTQGTAPRNIREAPKAFESGVQMDAASREARRVRRRGNATEQDLDRVDAMTQAAGQLMQETDDGFVSGAAMLLGQIKEPFSIAVYRGSQAGLLLSGAAVAASPFTGGASLVGVGPAAKLGFVGGFTASMVQDSYENIAGMSYVNMRRKGISEENAQVYSGVAGILGATLEMAGQIPIFGQANKVAGGYIARKVADRVVGRGLGRAGLTAVKDAGLTVGSESLTEGAQVYSDAVALHVAQRAEGMRGVLDTPEGRQQVFDEAIDETLMIVKGMTLLSLPLPLMNFAGDVRRLRRSKDRVNRLKRAINAVANSKTAQRNPDAMQELIDARTGNDPSTDLYLDGAQADVILRQGEIDPRSLDGLVPGFSERLAQAVATGGDIRLTSGEFLAKLAQTDVGKAMTPHLRVGDPNDLSSLSQAMVEQEAAATLNAIKTEGERAGGKAQEFAESVNRVEDDIVGMLEATGQLNPEEIRAFSTIHTSFVARLASEYNMTPEQFWAQHRNEIVGFRAPQLAAPLDRPNQFTQEGVRKTDTPEFKAWNERPESEGGANKLSDATGQPMRFYHGTQQGGFAAFDTNFIGTGAGYSRGGFSFVNVRDRAQSYAERGDVESRVTAEQIQAVNQLLQEPGMQERFDAAGFPEQVAFSEGDPMLWDALGSEEVMDGLREWIDRFRQAGDADMVSRLWSIHDLTEPRGVPQVYEVYLYAGQNVREVSATPDTIGDVLAGIDVRTQPGGAIIVNMPDGEKVVIVSDPTNIKSTDNRGTFSRATANIYEQARVPAPDAGVFDANNPPAPLADGQPIVAVLTSDGEVLYDRAATMHGDLAEKFPDKADLIIDGGFVVDGQYQMGQSRGGWSALEGEPDQVALAEELAAKANERRPQMLFQQPVLPPQKITVKHKREKTTGRYVGAPDWIGGNPRMLVELRKKLRQLALEGQAGRMWYENSSRAILDIAGGNIDEAERIVSLIAIYSPNATVPANTSMALTAYFQWKAGEPINAGFSMADKKAEELLRQNKPWDGIKTNSFYQNLMVEIDSSRLDPGVATMDMWMALAFDYGSKSLDQGPKYRFSEREIQRLAAELGWKPHQVQAAIWTAMKGRIDPIRGKLKEVELANGIGQMVTKIDSKTGTRKEQFEVAKGRLYDHYRLAHKMGMEYDLKLEDIEASKYDFSDAIRERLVQMSWEATPSTQTGRSLPGIHTAPIEQKSEYLQAVRAAITENGRNLIADLAGLPQGTTIEGYSAWLGQIGAGAQTFVPAPLEGTGKARKIKPVAADILNLASDIYGYVLEQDAVVYHTPIWDDAKKRHNGIELTSARPFTYAEMQQLYAAIHAKFGTWELAPAYRPDGGRILNFTDLDNAAFHKGMKEVIEALPDDFGGGTIELETFRSDGNYLSNDWTKDTNGEGYLARIAARQPGLLPAVIDLRARVEAVNRDFVARYGWDAAQPAATAAATAAAQPGAVTGQEYRQAAVPGMPDEPQGTFDVETFITRLNKNANIYTLIHESSHYWLEVMGKLVAAPDAPRRIAADFDTVLQWFGIAGANASERAANWNSMTLEQKRPHHEAWARNIELYMAEGKAPSLELQSAFERFMQWMKRFYVSMRDQFNEQYKREFGKDMPFMSSEVREVMERILASDEQIERAKAVRNAMALFDVRPDGMTDAEWEALQDMQLEADIESLAAMRAEAMKSMKWLRRAERGVIRDMQKDTDAMRAEVRADIAAAVERQPVYRARAFLSRGRMVDEDGVETVVKDHRLDIDAVRQMYEREPEKLRPNLAKLGTGAYGMMGKNGMNPEVAASLFGYPSADAMIRDVIDAPPIDEAIEAQTDARMLAENGAMNTPAQREDAVDRALHGELRARLIATQLRLVAKAMQPVRVLQAAARQVARQVIGDKRIRDIRVREYVSAESRAARDAAEAYRGMPDPKRIGDAAYTRALNEQMSAVAAGMPMSDAQAIAEDARKAAVDRANARRDEYRAKYPSSNPDAVLMAAKRNELLNHELAREAIASQAEVDKALVRFRRLFKADKDIAKTRNMDKVAAARAILAAFGLGRSEKAISAYMEQIRKYDPEMADALQPMIDRVTAGATDYREMTLNDFRTMRDAVEALWFSAKRDQEVVIEGRTMRLESVVTELNGRLAELRGSRASVGKKHAMTWAQRRWQELLQGIAKLRVVESWAEAMDAKRPRGAFTMYLWRPINDATSAYVVDKTKYITKYKDLISGLDLPVGKIVSDETELNYTFGAGNGGLGKAEVLGAMQHMGNESNFRKLLLGRGWGEIDAEGNLVTARWDKFVARMFAEGVVTKADMDALQAIWNLNEEIKPLAQKAHKEIFGYYFGEIEATPVVTPFGTYPGGYVPAKQDTALVPEASIRAQVEQLENDFRSAMPSTGFGFTKGRVDYNVALSLDLHMMMGHIDSVIRFAHVQPAIKDVLKIINNREFAAEMNNYSEAAIKDMILPWLNAAARQSITESIGWAPADNMFRGLRSRTGVSIMMGNVKNSLENLTGFPIAVYRIDPTSTRRSVRLARGAFKQYLNGPTRLSDSVAAASPFMTERMSSQIFEMQNEVNKILRKPNAYSTMKAFFARNAYFMQIAVQNVMDTVIWTATYNRAIDDIGMSMDPEAAHLEAVNQADSNIRLTQASMRPIDAAAFEAGTPFYQAFTQFMNWSNRQANLQATEWTVIMRDLGWRSNKGRMFMLYLLTFAIPSIMSSLLAKTVMGRWDEEDDGYIDDVMEVLLGSQVRMGVGMIPGGTYAYPLITGGFTDNTYDDKVMSSPAMSKLTQAAVGTGKLVRQVIDPEKDVNVRNVHDALTLVNLLFGIPADVIARPLVYAIEVEQGKIEPTGTIDYLRGLVTGSASAGTRQ